MTYKTDIMLIDRQLTLLRIQWKETENMLERKRIEVRAEDLKADRDRYQEAERLGIPVEQVRKRIRTVDQAIERAKQLSLGRREDQSTGGEG